MLLNSSCLPEQYVCRLAGVKDTCQLKVAARNSMCACAYWWYVADSGAELCVCDYRSDGWGDKGYIRLARGNSKNAPGQCGVAMQASYPIKTGPNPPPTPPTPSPKPGPSPGPHPPPGPEPQVCDTSTQCPAGELQSVPLHADRLSVQGSTLQQEHHGSSKSTSAV